MTIDERLAELGIELPEAPKAVGKYVLSVQTGNLLYTSGIGPQRDGQFPYQGHLGSELTIEEGQAAARLCMLNLLSLIRDAVGSLDRVARVVKVLGFVASAPGFGQQPSVMNGASQLLIDVFGERGRHARSAIGVNELPLNIAVEIEMIVELLPPA
ncbi:MAG: RidA family protein [Anaerolineales bacterium]|nr:RidA family protein [Anaerolineales bacterium]